MKKLTNAILVLFLFSNWASAQKNDCFRKTNFGQAELCLPAIEGYQECYSDPAFKYLADQTEVSMNMVLGFYVNNQTFAKKDSLGTFSFDDYFKIYGTKQLKDYEAGADELQQMQEVLAGNFIAKNWDTVEKEIDKLDIGLEIGVPVMVKSYKPNKNAFTVVLIAKYQIEGTEPYTLVMTINGLLLNKRMVWMAYYLNYTGEDSVKRVQEKSNQLVEKLLGAGRK